VRADACPELVEGKRTVSLPMTDFTRFSSASKPALSLLMLDAVL
jgi:hypothetical protein